VGSEGLSGDGWQIRQNCLFIPKRKEVIPMEEEHYYTAGDLGEDYGVMDPQYEGYVFVEGRGWKYVGFPEEDD